MTNFHDRERRGATLRVRIFQKPAQKNLLRLLEAGLPPKQDSEQQNYQHQPKSWSLHYGSSETGNVTSDK